MLINNRLSNRFWAKAIEMANYFRNRLPTKTKIQKKIIL